MKQWLNIIVAVVSAALAGSAYVFTNFESKADHNRDIYHVSKRLDFLVCRELDNQNCESHLSNVFPK